MNYNSDFNLIKLKELFQNQNYPKLKGLQM